MEQKEAPEKTSFVKWFSEINKNSGTLVGGKGANLGEMYNNNIPVPPGFVVTAQAYTYFIEKAGIKEKIEELLGRINYEDTQQLDEITRQIRTFIIDSKLPEDLQEEIIESYELLDAKPENIEKGAALDILKNSAEPVFVAVRSSATTEDLAEASFAGQQDTYLNIKGKKQLLEHIKKCFASLFTSRATYYRNKKGFPHDKSYLAVVVQKMINSDKSGVMFSRDPTNKSDNIIIEAVWGLGEGIVSGKITPDHYIISHELEVLDKKIADKKIALTRTASGEKSEARLSPEKSRYQVLKEHEIMKLADYAQRLEEHYHQPQDIEFAISDGELYIVQTRPITTIKKSEEKKEYEELEGEIIIKGFPASHGIAVGNVRLIEDSSDLNKLKEGDILVTKMTNPDMVVAMQRASAIITDDGGLTAHAAIVSREMGIPCIVGTGDATQKLQDEQTITVDAFNGKVYRGKIGETTKKQVKPVETKTKTELKVIVDLPSFAERSAKTGLKKIGLTRIEGIIAESGKHPNYFKENKNMQDYEELIYKGINRIAENFEEIWVRTSDIRSDEYRELEGAPQEKEPNPMLGMHGIRFSLKNPEIFKAELIALKRVSENNKTIGVLFPQVINLSELQEAKKIINELDFKNIKIGVMIETPAAIQLIRDFCEEGIDFISFGTNDLTQYMLAIDRGNEEVQDMYNEMHPSILYQIGYVIRVCKRYNVETSICGQAGSKKEMVKYLVEKGINSISVNADVASDIAEYIKEIEEEIIKGTDKEPREYLQKKEAEENQEKDNQIQNSENHNYEIENHGEHNDEEEHEHHHEEEDNPQVENQKEDNQDNEHEHNPQVESEEEHHGEHNPQVENQEEDNQDNEHEHKEEDQEENNQKREYGQEEEHNHEGENGEEHHGGEEHHEEHNPEVESEEEHHGEHNPQVESEEEHHGEEHNHEIENQDKNPEEIIQNIEQEQDNENEEKLKEEKENKEELDIY